MKNFTEKIIESDKKYLWHPFTQMKSWLESEPVVIDSAEGFYLIDTEGNRYIDAVSSLWCNVHGHRVKEIDLAVKDQLDKIAHSTLLGLGQTKSIELAEKLVRITPAGLEKVFYSDSGATAVEIALKIAYQYYKNRRQERPNFIALENSYHGDTVGSVSVGGIKIFHGIFGPLLFNAEFAPAPHPYRFEGTGQRCMQNSLDKIESLLKKQNEKICAVIIEPLVQGAAGMLVHPEGFLKAVRELTEKYEVLLIADEVATGFGRTGKMFACEHENITPDLMCLAKGITGGYLPLAATVTTEKVFEAFLGDIFEHKTFYHGHTYTGNALGCAAAAASLELFKKNKIIEGLPPKIELIQNKLERIAGLEYAGDVRQRGMMAGIELVENKETKKPFDYTLTTGAKTCAAMRPKGVMARPLGDVLIIMPPPAIDLATLEKMLDVYADTIENDLPRIIGDSK